MSVHTGVEGKIKLLLQQVLTATVCSPACRRRSCRDQRGGGVLVAAVRSGGCARRPVVVRACYGLRGVGLIENRCESGRRRELPRGRSGRRGNRPGRRALGRVVRESARVYRPCTRVPLLENRARNERGPTNSVPCAGGGRIPVPSTVCRRCRRGWATDARGFPT